MVKVSVIVPIYAVEKYILGCLRSIAAQTHADFECICVDDGTRDRAGQMADEFAKTDARFRVIHQENKGLSGARNTGLKNAAGDVIAFVDSDDYIHPRMFEVLLSAMDTVGVDVAGCALADTDDVYAPIQPAIKDYDTKVFDAPLTAFMTNRSVITSACSRLYKKSAIQGMSFIEGIAFEDVPWTVEVMSEIGKYALADVPLYFYYTNPDSIMRSPWSNHKTDSYVAVINAVYDYISRNRPADLADMQRHILNRRIKMVFNRIRGLPRSERAAAWAYLKPRVRALHRQKRISYAGLKLRHKLILWIVLHG